jgi:hypothetical protein
MIAAGELATVEADGDELAHDNEVSRRREEVAGRPRHTASWARPTRPVQVTE